MILTSDLLNAYFPLNKYEMTSRMCKQYNVICHKPYEY